VQDVNGKLDLVSTHMSAHVALPRVLVGVHAGVDRVERVLIEYYVAEFTLVGGWRAIWDGFVI